MAKRKSDKKGLPEGSKSVTGVPSGAPSPPSGLPRPLPQLVLASPEKWHAWLAKNHAASSGVGLVLPKKDAGSKSTLTYANALEQALIWGWIDGQKAKLDDTAWIQRFGPRRARSMWSKVNVAKAQALIAAGKMQPSGLAEVERAQQDGRWAAAYDSPSTAQPHPELAAALAKSRQASASFAALDARNRYAIVWRVQTAKKPETRAKRIAELVAMLARGEVLHPKKT